MEFKVLSKTDNTVISVANIGNDCIVSKATYGLGSGILTDTITFVPRMNIGYCIDGQDVVPKLKITGIPETATQSYTFTDGNVMVGEFTKAIMDKKKDAEIQEIAEQVVIKQQI